MTESIKDFMLQDLAVIEETEEVKFPHFAQPFKIRSLTGKSLKTFNANQQPLHATKRPVKKIRKWITSACLT